MKTNGKTLTGKIIIICLIAIIIVSGAIFLNNLNEKSQAIENLNTENTQLNKTIETRDSLVNELASTFDEIEDNLTFINEKRGQLKLQASERKRNVKNEIIADIKLMNEMLDESSKKIDELNKKLNSSGFEIRAFRNRITKLTQQIEEQNNQIAFLKTELDKRDNKIVNMNEQIVQLENNIALVNDSLEEKIQIITEKDYQLNKAYFVSGTLKELVENGVLKKEGGFLGIGKHKSLRDNLNSEYFTELDQRNTLSFPLFSKKANIISEHPDSSYRFVYKDDLISYLEIENPEAFWKVSKYAVVEVK